MDTATEQLNFFDPQAIAPDLGQRFHALVAELYPICRSITGQGVRESLKILSRVAPMQIHEVPTGTHVFDWQVPREWNIKEAWIKDPSGNTIVDFTRCNLHVVNYSMPVRAKVSLDELKKHLHSLPDQPELIPYRTSYYNDSWGFCLPDRQLKSLPPGDYDVLIDSTLQHGSLTYGELVLPGQTQDEVLISCHVCHPSLCNDNLAAMAITSHLARELAGKKLRYTYRFLYIPGTIGSIVWLSQNQRQAARIKHGLVCTCMGDPGHMTYKKSRRGNAVIDRIVQKVLNDSGQPFKVVEFYPYGYDERQYCSPGFNLPVGGLMRTPHGQYPQYHTSADNLDLVTPAAMSESYLRLGQVIQALESDRILVNAHPHCEPQLGKRGLYRTTGGTTPGQWNMALLWTLNLSDGDHTLLEIAERSEIPFAVICKAAEALFDVKLLEEPREPAGHGIFEQI
jgi:aminopeptidase-like protein